MNVATSEVNNSEGIGVQAHSTMNESTGISGFFQEHWQKLVAALLWLLILGAYFGYVTANNLTHWGAVQSLFEVLRNPFWGPILFILAYTLRPLIFFSAAVLTIAGGALFGPLFGIIYTVIGANASAMVAYVIGRYFGEDLLDDNEEEKGFVKRYANRMRQDSFETVMIMRFIFLPYDLVNYLAGLLRIDWKAFLLATVLGSIPGTIAFSFFGASIDLANYDGGFPEFDWRVAVAGVAVFAVSIGLSRYFKKREQPTTVEDGGISTPSAL